MVISSQPLVSVIVFIPHQAEVTRLADQRIRLIVRILVRKKCFYSLKNSLQINLTTKAHLRRTRQGVTEVVVQNEPSFIQLGLGVE